MTKLLPSLLCGLFVAGCATSPEEKKPVYADRLVRVMRENTVVVNPRANDPLVLFVGKKRFPWLQGREPYYYEVDGGRRILFSLFKAGINTDASTAILYDLRTGHVEKLDLSHFRWGANGRTGAVDSTDNVMESSGGRVTLISTSYEYREEIELALDPLRIVGWRKLRDGKVFASER